MDFIYLLLLLLLLFLNVAYELLSMIFRTVVQCICDIQ